MFKDLLNWIKIFKYQVTLKVFLSKYKWNTDREFALVCFNSTTKALFAPKYSLNESFQGVFK